MDLKEYYKALSVRGAVKYVSFEGKAAVIRDSQIEAIRKAVDGELQIEIVQKCIEKGQYVRIVSGILQGCEGVFVENHGKSRFVINLSSVGFAVKVKVNAADVEKI